MNVGNLGGLWKAQYAPREKALLKLLNKKTKTQWKKKTRMQKLVIIDRLQAKGRFW